MGQGDGFAFKRQEGFRLAFKEPIEATFILLTVQGEKVTSKKGTAKLLDMSLKGAKMSSKLELPTTDLKLRIEFELNEEKLDIDCGIVWRRLGFKEYLYGLTFDSDSYEEAKLLAELKGYVVKSR